MNTKVGKGEKGGEAGGAGKGGKDGAGNDADGGAGADGVDDYYNDASEFGQKKKRRRALKDKGSAGGKEGQAGAAMWASKSKSASKLSVGDIFRKGPRKGGKSGGRKRAR